MGFQILHGSRGFIFIWDWYVEQQRNLVKLHHSRCKDDLIKYWCLLVEAANTTAVIGYEFSSDFPSDLKKELAIAADGLLDFSLLCSITAHLIDWQG